MKIMKRNGSEAAFDREKIAAAVTKANLATDQPPELLSLIHTPSPRDS